MEGRSPCRIIKASAPVTAASIEAWSDARYTAVGEDPERRSEQDHCHDLPRSDEQLPVDGPDGGLRNGDHLVDLWVIRKGRKPGTLGLVATDRPGWKPTTHSTVAFIREGAVLSMLVEPRGGSPTGQPTGPVILRGAVEAR